MAAFLVIIIRIHDFDGMVQAGYAKRSIPLAKSFGATYRMFGTGAELVEGDAKWDGARPVILEFPDVEAARAFWFGEYQEIRKLRDGHTEALAFITDQPWMTDEQEAAYLAAHP